MSDIVERLKSGVREIGLADDNNTELFDIEDANETMFLAATEITRLQAELAEARKALQLIQSAAEQSGEWPPHRRDATLDGIEKVAIRALKSPKPQED